jgi:hypothetical protein
MPKGDGRGRPGTYKPQVHRIKYKRQGWQNYGGWTYITDRYFVDKFVAKLLNADGRPDLAPIDSIIVQKTSTDWQTIETHNPNQEELW